MDRTKLIFRRYPAQLTLAIGILLGAVILFATCLTSLASAAPDRFRIFAGGDVKQSDIRSMSSLLSAHGMKPGDVVKGTVVIANDGKALQRFFLGAGVCDTAGSGGGRLSQELHLVVSDVTQPGHAHDVYSGSVANLANASVGSVAGGESRTFLFTVTFPRDADQSFAGSSLSVSFDWTATK
jgi:hypothetical protein